MRGGRIVDAADQENCRAGRDVPRSLIAVFVLRGPEQTRFDKVRPHRAKIRGALVSTLDHLGELSRIAGAVSIHAVAGGRRLLGVVIFRRQGFSKAVRCLEKTDGVALLEALETLSQ